MLVDIYSRTHYSSWLLVVITLCVSCGVFSTSCNLSGHYRFFRREILRTPKGSFSKMSSSSSSSKDRRCTNWSQSRSWGHMYPREFTFMGTSSGPTRAITIDPGGMAEYALTGILSQFSRFSASVNLFTRTSWDTTSRFLLGLKSSLASRNASQATCPGSGLRCRKDAISVKEKGVWGV